MLSWQNVGAMVASLIVNNSCSLVITRAGVLDMLEEPGELLATVVKERPGQLLTTAVFKGPGNNKSAGGGARAFVNKSNTRGARVIVHNVSSAGGDARSVGNNNSFVSIVQHTSPYYRGGQMVATLPQTNAKSVATTSPHSIILMWRSEYLNINLIAT